MLDRPTAIDLFSGCGGLTLGLRQSGFHVLAAVDSDKLAVDTYRRNHRRVRIWHTDIRRLPVSSVMDQLELEAGDLDLLAGCPPCQGFSTVRTLNGTRRTASEGDNLIFDFLRFVRVLKPKTIMLENVPGLAKNWRIKRFRSTIRKLGYAVDAKILNAAHFSIPQRRRRFILMASRIGKPVFAEPQSEILTVREAIGHLPRPGRADDPCHDIKENRSEKVRAIIRDIPRNGGSRAALGKRRQLKCHKNQDGFKDIYGRMAWDKVAPTITGGFANPSKGRFLHPTQNRAITLREAALLQGFPPTYYFALDRGKFSSAQMIGNALPPAFVARHATKLKHIISRHERKMSHVSS